MRAGFLITSLGHGIGGHFHDVRSLYISWLNSKTIQTDLICLKSVSSVLKDLPHRTLGVLFTNELDVYDVVYCFDLVALYYAEINNAKTVYVKCGGPNIKGLPKISRIIVMSHENYDWFVQRGGYEELRLIPNRVLPVNNDTQRIAELKEMVEGKSIILRIGRISEHYKSTLIQSIHLLHSKLNKGEDVHLVIIGPIESEDLHNLIQVTVRESNISERVLILSNNKWTTNAHELIDSASYIVGTGRGFMEAAYLSKEIYVPVSDGDLPVKVTKENIDFFFRWNFSPRSPILNLEKIVHSEGIDNMDWLKEYFESNFDASGSIERYMSFRKPTGRNLSLTSIFRLTPYFLKRWFWAD